MEDDILASFPQIRQARACVAQREYDMAADIYTDVLIDARKTHDERGKIMCLIYLEYSSALISLCFANNYDKLNGLLNRNLKGVNLAEGDDDLETAWELLEICRITFTASGDEDMLKKTHFLLGEVLLNNNKEEEALIEYEKAGESAEVLYRKALCYEFMKKYDESISILKSIEVDDDDLRADIESEIAKLTIRRYKSKSCENGEFVPKESGDVIDISSLVRRKGSQESMDQ